MSRGTRLETADLDAAQRLVLEHLAKSDLGAYFTLTGGTALAAFYLHHRHSEDLDLFSDGDVPLDSINAMLTCISGLTVKSFERRYDRKVFTLSVNAQPLKVEFTKFPYPHVCGREEVAPGLWIDSPDEILVNKLLAMTDRREPKDDVDVYFLLRRPESPSLLEGITLAERKFGVQGLRYSLQSRLLAVPAELPSTSPAVPRAAIAAAFSEEVKRLIAAFAVE